MGETPEVRGAEQALGIVPGIGGDQPETDAGGLEGREHLVHAVEQRDRRRVVAHHRPEVVGDARQLPGGQAAVPDQVGNRAAAQRFDLVRLDAGEAVFVGQPVLGLQEEGKTVGKRAVEVEDRERIGHGRR